MNKRRHRLKHRKNAVRITLEPDYGHEAWGSDIPPTPVTVPDAFYRSCEPVYPREPAPETRQKPHQSLSASMLRKRLYRAGLKGVEAKRVLREIMAGDEVEDGVAISGSWGVPSFRKQFGRRIALAVLRFVHIQVIVLDEFAYYASPGLADFVQKAMSIGRTHSASPLVVEQTLPLPVAVARRVSFRY